MTLLTVVDAPADTRPAPGLITGATLSAVWPEVSHRLAKLLTSRGAAPDVVDDVVQEVAARVLAKGIVFDDAMDLMRWAVPVALNLLVDNARADQRVTPVAEDFDEPVNDVAEVVVHRDRLRRVLGALPELSAADRAALTGPEVPAGDRKEAVRLAVRRHRARRRLLALVDGVAAFTALLGALLRRSGRTAGATVAVAVVPVAFLGITSGQVPVTPTPLVETVTQAHERPVRPVRPARVTRPAPPAARPVLRAAVVRAEPAPVRTAPKVARRTPVRVEQGRTRISVGGRDRTANDGLVCIRRTGVVEDLCVYQPRVGSGGGQIPL